MQFLARPDPDRFHITTRGDCVGHFHQFHARNLGNKNFTAMHLLDTTNHQPDPLLGCDPEAGHPRIGDGDLAALALLLEYWNHATPAAQHVSVARTTEPSILRAGVGVRLNKHFFRAEFGRAIKVDRVYRFVGAQSQNATNPAVDGCIDDIAATHNVCLDSFKRIVFAGWNLLERCGVNHHCDSGKSAFQALRIADIADEITQTGMVESRGPHVMLLQFVTAEDDELLRAVFVQHQFDELPAKRACPSGDQYNLFGPIHRYSPSNASLCCIRLKSGGCQRQYSEDKRQSCQQEPPLTLRNPSD